MDLRAWEDLWKALAIVGIANLFAFFVIFFVLTSDNSLVVWILIVIETGCYVSIVLVRRHIQQLLR
ncbi:hypothetical protein DYY65_07460 [Nitrososphaera sp. AFS]|nr:hypothetical protein [Nitrososphaera sp. AFS]